MAILRSLAEFTASLRTLMRDAQLETELKGTITVPVTTSEQYDYLLDQATQAAIQGAERDYPSFSTVEALKEEGRLLAQLICSNFPEGNQKQSSEVYIGIFVAAYNLRRQALVNFPTANHRQGSL